MPFVTSELLIKLREDGAKGVATALQGVAKSERDIERFAKVPAVSKLTTELKRLEAQGTKLGQVRTASRGLDQASTAMRAAKQNAAALGKAMAGVERPTASMRAGLRAAEQAVQRTTADFKRQGVELRQMRADLSAAGVPLHKLAEAEKQVQAGIKGTTAALTQEIELQNRAATAAERATRMRAGLAREMMAAANEEAAANRKAAAEADRHARAEQHEASEGRRHRWQHGAPGMLVGAAAGYVSAHAVAEGIGEAVKVGAEYQHERVALVNAGRTPAEMAQIEAASRATSQAVPTSSYLENLKVINETVGAFGTLGHAIENLPFMQKSMSVLKGAAGDKIDMDAGEMGNTLARFFELRGTAGNGEVFRSEAAEMVRAMAFSRGNFNPQEMMNFGQQAGQGTLSNYSLRFLSKIAPSLITELHGDRAGTAANAFRSVIMGKVADGKQVAAWKSLGLLDMSKVQMKAGHAVSWTAGAVKGTDEFLQDPLAAVEKYLIPAMQAKGIDVDNQLAVSKELGTLFRNTNANRFAEAITQARSRQRLHKDETNINNAGSLDDIYDRNVKEEPSTALSAVSAQWNNVLTSMTGPMMQTAAAGLGNVAKGIGAIADALKAHPDMAMATGVTAAAAGLAGSGYMSWKLMTGFGLPASAAALDTSAVALDASAAALTRAAGLMGAEGALGKGAAGAAARVEGAAAGAAAGQAERGGIRGLGRRLLGMGSAAAGGAEVGGEGGGVYGALAGIVGAMLIEALPDLLPTLRKDHPKLAGAFDGASDSMKRLDQYVPDPFDLASRGLSRLGPLLNAPNTRPPTPGNFWADAQAIQDRLDARADWADRKLDLSDYNPTMIRRRATEPPITPQRSAPLDDATYERARRAQVGNSLDPTSGLHGGADMEAARGAALSRLPTPHLDTGQVQSQAEQAGAQIKEAMSVTATPTISTASIDAYMAKVEAAIAKTRQLGQIASGVAAGIDPSGAPVPASHHVPAYAGR